MNNTLTLRDLLMPGEPLDPAEVMACPDRLGNSVSWVVSLRPYPPAFPRLRGGELALVATEQMERLDPPTTLADVVRQLASRGASGLAVRGTVDKPAIEAAKKSGLPILRLGPDEPLHDIEQAVVRLCALYQARREIEVTSVEDKGAWLDDLLAGRISNLAEAQSGARRQGVKLANGYAVAYLGESGIGNRESGIDEDLISGLRKTIPMILVREWGNGLALLLPAGTEDRAVEAFAESGVPCGVGSVRPLLDAPASLEEAQLAATASALLSGGRPVRYAEMGADRLLALLHRDRPQELRGFVEETIGPLLKYDETAPSPVLPTLRAFVAHGGRLRETAEEMSVHRNTLAYRLDKVEALLGVDLQEPSARLAIELALRALPLVG